MCGEGGVNIFIISNNFENIEEDMCALGCGKLEVRTVGSRMFS